MVKCAVSNSGGDNHQGVGNGTDGTVAAYVANFDLILTFGLCSIGSGTAAIQLDSVNAAELEHELSLLCIGKTYGVGLVVTVGEHKNNRTVCFDTDSGTGILVDSVQTGNYCAVLNEHKVSAYCLNNVVSIVAELVLVADNIGTVVELSKELVGVTGCSAVDVYAFHNERAGRLTGGNIIVSGVGRSYYVVASLGFCGIRLFYNSRLAPNAGVVVVMIIGFDLCSTVVDVTVNYKVLHALAVLIIRNDGCLGYAGSQSGFGRRRDRQTVLGTLNSRSRKRDDRYQHQCSENHSDDTKHRFVFLHFSLSFIKKIFNHCPKIGQIITGSYKLIEPIGTAFVREHLKAVVADGSFVKESSCKENSQSDVHNHGDLLFIFIASVEDPCDRQRNEQYEIIIQSHRKSVYRCKTLKDS